MNGKGLMKNSNGDEYDGEWMYSSRHGKGVMKYSNGDTYYGEWKDDKYMGESTQSTAQDMAAKDACIAELKQQLKRSAAEVVNVKRERDEHESRADLQDTIIQPLEAQRRELQEEITESVRQLITVDSLPIKRQRVDEVPSYYRCLQVTSNSKMLNAPWNAKENRAMTLSESVNWASKQTW